MATAKEGYDAAGVSSLMSNSALMASAGEDKKSADQGPGAGMEQGMQMLAENPEMLAMVL